MTNPEHPRADTVPKARDAAGETHDHLWSDGRLPWRVRPYQHEDLESYYHRLLRLNHLPIIGMRSSLPRIAKRYTGSSTRMLEGALEHLAGLSTGYLDLLTGADIDPCGLDGCYCAEALTKSRFQCVACSKGEEVKQRPNLAAFVCKKHHRWVGPGATPKSQDSLLGLPLFNNAASRHDRLVKDARLHPFRFRSVWAAFDEVFYRSSWRPNFPVPAPWTARRDSPNPATYPAALVMYSTLEDPKVLTDLLDPRHSAKTLERALMKLVEVRTRTEATPALGRALRYLLRPDLYRVALATTPGWKQPSDPDYPVKPIGPFDRDLSELEYTAWPAQRQGVPPGYPGFDVRRSPLYIEKHDRHGRRFEFWFAPRGRLYTDEKVSRSLVTWICPAGHLVRATPKVRCAMTTAFACGKCSGKTAVPGVSDFGTTVPEALPFWDEENNPTKNSWDVGPGSTYPASWRCRSGHHWEQPVNSFVRVPSCRGCRSAAVNRVSLLAVPQLRSWWDGEKNSAFDPEALDARYDLVHWICPERHEFEATIKQMKRRKSPCRICVNREIVAGVNDLATVRPDIAAEFDEALNRPFTASQVAPYSPKVYWWTCGVEGHRSFPTSVQSRTSENTRCGQCAGTRVTRGVNDLQTLRPSIAARWHPVLNGALTPYDVMARSGQHVFFQCPCGAPQPSTVNNMVEERLCRSCAARLRWAGIHRTRKPRRRAR